MRGRCHDSAFVRHCAAISLLFVFLALGTGAFEYVHNHEHLHDDAEHGATNCLIHSHLHAPMLATAWLPLLICLGLFIAFLSLITSPLVSQRAILRFDCRGPPARC